MDTQRIKESAAALAAEAVEIRRYLHAHPETSWNEVETSLFIENKLKELGLQNIRRGFGGTESGVTADLVGGKEGRCVALRADIDAFPLQERNSCEYKSLADSVMHACGHDGHMAVLLCAAKLLASMKDKLPGKVRFIFQPAEESGKRSGAKEMIAKGVLDGVDAIGGMHVWSFVPTGVVHWKNGPVMASADGWKVTFTGKGGHGAMPHEAIDPTVAAADFIGAVQTIVSRELNPVDTAVVSIGKMTSGDAFNIIPPTAELVGNLRSFNPEVRASMEGRLTRIADGIASAYRCGASTEISYFYPSVINNPAVTEALRDVAVEFAGEENVKESPLLMVSEDFSFFQDKVPGTFFFLGAGNEAKGASHPHHSPFFEIDEDALPLGVSLMSAFAFEALERLADGRIK